tara:strand:- start:80 stop:274 length:195 start_codon:yes stop_codon:yes gene_type:complete
VGRNNGGNYDEIQNTFYNKWNLWHSYMDKAATPKTVIYRKHLVISTLQEHASWYNFTIRAFSKG